METELLTLSMWGTYNPTYSYPGTAKYCQKPHMKDGPTLLLRAAEGGDAQRTVGVSALPEL